MKILFVNGSPRRGNTALVLEALAARLGAHEVETANLSGLRVNGCIGCLKCQQDVDHFVCHQEGDDANAVLAKIVSADAVLLATPLTGTASQLSSSASPTGRPRSSSGWAARRRT